MLDGVKPGTYTVYLQHRRATASGHGGDAHRGRRRRQSRRRHRDNTTDTMDYQAMTDAMMSTMSQYPAATEGVGNPILEPTEVKADGTKVFDLVAAITPWERAPGDVVDAWT